MDASSGLPKHSPLGASGASRWMLCPGSVGQSEGIVDEESEFALEGTAAHMLGEDCLIKKKEAWEYIGGMVAIYEIIVTKDMADAVQSYIDLLNEWHPERHQGNSWIERGFHCPTIHKWFYGTADFVHLTEDNVLHVWDYKHGAGIVVEATGNPQCSYYAAGILEDLGLWDHVDDVVIHIVQPRGWHMDGPHRTWEITTDYLDAWLFDECVPSMEIAEVSRDTTPGTWCRFCPARSRRCPSIMAAMAELEEMLIMALGKEKGAEELTPAQVGRLMDLQELGKIVFKAAGKTAYGMLNAGVEVPGMKLVAARTNREYKDKNKKGITVEAAAKKAFGKKCMSKPVLMSPAQLDSLPNGKAFTALWAFKPEGKLTVAIEGDPRRRVNRDMKSLFTKKETK